MSREGINVSPRNIRRRRMNLMSFDDAYPVLDIIRGPSQNGWYECNCPAHLDEHASMGAKEDEDTGALVVFCHAGCLSGEIVRALRELADA